MQKFVAALTEPVEKKKKNVLLVVYLTCLHESGHALGLRHTAAFADIMYSFQYGGDIPAYFQRYRQLLKIRADIKEHSGISDADRAAIRGSK